MAKGYPLASYSGVLGDYDRFEAYLRDIMQLSIAVNAAPAFGGGFGCRVRLGPTFDFPMHDFPGESEVYLGYGGILTYSAESIDISGGIVGRVILNKTVSDAGVEQIESSIRLHFDHFHPGIQVRTPLDAYLQRVMDIELGINLAYEF